MEHQVTRVERWPAEPDADWGKVPWPGIEPLRLERFMGNRPDHFPGVQVKLAYDEDSLHCIFRVEDRHVRAVADRHQGPVCRDSCVEFFFTPGADPAKGYFNLETNCGGTMLFHFQTEPRKNSVLVSERDLGAIRLAHTLPRIVEPELDGPVVWTLEYALHIEMLKRYADVTVPAPGAVWRANFYKCGDKTSHPHWLTWAPVEHPGPNFHLPRFFGVLEFQ